MPMEQRYDWGPRDPGERPAARASATSRTGEVVFEAALALRRREMTPQADGARARDISADDASPTLARIYSRRCVLRRKGAPLARPPGGRGVSRLARAAVHAAFRRIEVRAARAARRPAPAGARSASGPTGAALRGTVVVHDPGFYVRLARDGSIGLGETYADGQWDSPDLVAPAADRRARDAPLGSPAARRCAAWAGRCAGCARTRSATRSPAPGATSPPTTTSATRCSSCSSTARR